MIKSLFTNPKIRHIVLFTVLYTVVFLSLHLFRHPFSILSVRELSEGHTILNMKGWYNADIAYEHLHTYSAEAIRIYKRIIYLDMLALIPGYTLLYFFFWRYLAFRTKAEKTKRYQSIVNIVSLAATSNFIEDTITLELLRKLPQEYPIAATISGILSTLKFVALITSALFLFISWLQLRKAKQ